jgi:TDG/mug DNA glycosylase family protein
MSDSHILPDMIGPSQRLWFVGTAAGPMSAALGAYYAHPGNRFWRALHEAGVTPRLYQPHEFPLLKVLGIGLTDICKTAWGVDSQLPKDSFDTEAFRAKVQLFNPAALAFTSKTAASHWLARPTSRIEVGRQPDTVRPAIFILPSPSGLATSYWSLDPWRDVANWLGER